jgi:hypothetical protein
MYGVSVANPNAQAWRTNDAGVRHAHHQPNNQLLRTLQSSESSSSGFSPVFDVNPNLGCQCSFVEVTQPRKF